jgi:hypothetical protein
VSLASSVSSLATRIATEIKAVRSEMTAYAKIQVPTAPKTAAYTAAMNDIVMVDPTAGPITITLPVIGSQTGRISVKNLGGANVVTVAAGTGNTIGSTAAASVPIRYADQVTTFQANGTNWVIPYNHFPPTVLSTYAPLASPTFTGTVTVPTPSNTTDATTKTYVDAADALKAPLASPTFTGTVTVPTPSNTTDATTKTYVDAADALKAPLASPTFTGTVTVPTPSATTAATTKAYVDATMGNQTTPFVPSEHSLLAWNYDPILSQGAYVPGVNGQMFGCTIRVWSSFTCTGVAYSTTTAGAGFTAGRNYIGIYNSAGTLLTQTADQSSSWTALGARSNAWNAAQSLTPGTYHIHFLVWATTVPQIAATAVVPSAAILLGRNTSNYRGFWYSGNPTTLPATRAAATGSDRPMWVGLY